MEPIWLKIAQFWLETRRKMPEMCTFLLNKKSKSAVPALLLFLQLYCGTVVSFGLKIWLKMEPIWLKLPNFGQKRVVKCRKCELLKEMSQIVFLNCKRLIKLSGSCPSKKLFNFGQRNAHFFEFYKIKKFEILEKCLKIRNYFKL